MRARRNSIRLLTEELDEIASSASAANTPQLSTTTSNETAGEENLNESIESVTDRGTVVVRPKPKSTYRTLTRTRKFVDSQGKEVVTSSTKIVIEGQENKTRDDFDHR